MMRGKRALEIILLLLTNTLRVLAVPAWYPFDWQQDPMYKVIFTIQCMGQFTVTNIYGMADTLIMSLLLVTGKQIELLGLHFFSS